MKTAYFHCHSGISGDMIVGALMDAGLDLSLLSEELKKLDLTGYRLEQKRVIRGGLAATKFDVVLTEDGGPGRGLNDILESIEGSSLARKPKETAGKIFLNLAEAEARVHGISVQDVHFHEVGAIDAVIDVVGCAVGLELLGVDRVLSSPVNLGAGTVRSSHGVLPVPPPAVMELLKGRPVYSEGPQAELTTPTGAAILSTLAERFGPLPPMEVQAIGCGAGSSDFSDMPNILRVFIGSVKNEGDVDSIAVIEANIDDMNPELYTPFMEKALMTGALDVFLTPIVMKKGRPGIKITILTEPAGEKKLSALLLNETTTFGLRVRYETREKLRRETVEVETGYGKVKVKLGRMDGKITQVSPEADSCAQLAARKKVPLKSIYDQAKKAALALMD
jgi:hypothetical protein